MFAVHLHKTQGPGIIIGPIYIYTSKFPQGRLRTLDAPELNSARPGSRTPHLPTFATSSLAQSPTWLELAGRARPGIAAGSKWPLEMAPWLGWGARNGHSSPLGAAGAPEKAARARSVPLGRSKWPLEPAQFGSPWPRKHCTCRRLRHQAPQDFMSLCFLRHIMHTYDIRHTQMMILLTSGESELS